MYRRHRHRLTTTTKTTLTNTNSVTTASPAPHLLSHWELVTHPPTAPISAAMRAMGSLDLSFESLGLDEMDLITRQVNISGINK